MKYENGKLVVGCGDYLKILNAQREHYLTLARNGKSKSSQYEEYCRHAFDGTIESVEFARAWQFLKYSWGSIRTIVSGKSRVTAAESLGDKATVQYYSGFNTALIHLGELSDFFSGICTGIGYNGPYTEDQQTIERRDRFIDVLSELYRTNKDIAPIVEYLGKEELSAAAFILNNGKTAAILDNTQKRVLCDLDNAISTYERFQYMYRDARYHVYCNLSVDAIEQINKLKFNMGVNTVEDIVKYAISYYDRVYTVNAANEMVEFIAACYKIVNDRRLTCTRDNTRDSYYDCAFFYDGSYVSANTFDKICHIDFRVNERNTLRVDKPSVIHSRDSLYDAVPLGTSEHITDVINAVERCIGSAPIAYVVLTDEEIGLYV